MVRRALLAAWLLALPTCSAQPAPPFEIVVRVESDSDKPIKGAAITHDGKKVGVSGVDGVAVLRLRGEEGESFHFMVQCPQDFDSPTKPIQVVLRKVVESSKKPEYEAVCTPSTRNVVVAVRAENGADVPVMHLGKEVGRTDESGAAHILLRLKPNETFELQLETSDKAFDRLRPQNPSATFIVKQQDEVFAFDQKFTIEKKKVVRGGPIGPTKLTH